MYYVLCTIVLHREMIHSYFYGTMNEFIFYILYFYAYMMTSYKYCALQSTFFPTASFHNLYFVYTKLVFTYILPSGVNVKLS